jgi:hypothetical protein
LAREIESAILRRTRGSDEPFLHPTRVLLSSEVSEMRMLLQVNFPHHPFNAAVMDGTAGQKIKQILEDAQPEAAYFTEIDGQRCAMLVVEVADASRIPAYAEPWFLTFDAKVRFRPVMTVDDLARANLETLGKQWSQIR